ncbi:MAG: BolA/IbaG family iron-sulfur metabolism protein [bacterium]|jgi:stress-induced morphogen
MMTPEMLKHLLEETFTDAAVKVFDLTGTSDHFEVQVVSDVFAGKSLIEQHKLVHAACGEHLTTTIHALKIKTSAPQSSL